MVRRWHGEGRTVVAVLHDLDLVRGEFPDTLLLARDALGWGPTAEVLTAANRLRARMMAEAWAAEAEECERRAAALPRRPRPEIAAAAELGAGRGRTSPRLPVGGGAARSCSRPSSNSASSAAPWSAAWRCRGRRRCSACSWCCGG